MCQLYLKKQTLQNHTILTQQIQSLKRKLCRYEKNSEGSERCITVFTVHLPLCSFKRVGDTDHAAHTTYMCVCYCPAHTLSIFGNHCCLPEGNGTEQGDFLLHVRLDACILYHVIKYACNSTSYSF